MKSLFLNKYIIFLLGVFNLMILNFMGEISPVLVFIIATFVLWFKGFDISNDPNAKKVIAALSFIIIFQLAYFPFSNVGNFEQFKGVAITISGLLHFMFFYHVFRKRTDLIKWFIVGLFISSYMFENVLVEQASEDIGEWKFGIFPRISSACFVLSTLFLKPNRKSLFLFFAFLLLFVGVLGIATGARSSGMIPFAAGVFGLYIFFLKRFSARKFLFGFTTGLLSMYAVYCFVYVPKVLDGSITGGNSEQLLKLENPYSPVSLLTYGRVDAVIPFVAFLDKPLFGWGWKAQDPNYIYNLKAEELRSEVDTEIYKNDTDRIKQDTIPGHSVLGYFSCSYGVFVFLALVLILLLIYKAALSQLQYKDSFFFYRLYIVISITWQFLFSAAPVLKYIPIYFAMLFAMDYHARQRQSLSNNEQTNNTCNNSHFRRPTIA